MSDHSLAADADEYLDPGFDAGTPDGDNLLNDFCRAEVEGWRRWSDAAGGRHAFDDESGVAWTDTSCRSVFGNPTHWTRPVAANRVDTVVADLAKNYGAVAGGDYVIFSAFPTPDLREVGLKAVGHPPLMVRPPGPPTSARAQSHPLRIERVRSRDQLLDFERTIIEAFPVDELIPWQPGSFVPEGLLSDDGWRLFVGYDPQGVPVATSAAFVSSQIVDVTWVSCRTDHRRRGYGEAITWAATQAAPTRPAMLVASDDGRPLYEQMGYITLTRYTLWIGQRPCPR